LPEKWRSSGTGRNCRLPALAERRTEAGAPTEDASVFALISGAAIVLVLAVLLRGVAPAVIGAAFATLASIGFRSLCHSKISGHTGDTLGAAAIIAEIAFLTGLASGL
jgi:adenosylcobinamide-GDP ribazoletransferase